MNREMAKTAKIGLKGTRKTTIGTGKTGIKTRISITKGWTGTAITTRGTVTRTGIDIMMPGIGQIGVEEMMIAIRISIVAATTGSTFRKAITHPQANAGFGTRIVLPGNSHLRAIVEMFHPAPGSFVTHKTARTGYMWMYMSIIIQAFM